MENVQGVKPKSIEDRQTMADLHAAYDAAISARNALLSVRGPMRLIAGPAMQSLIDQTNVLIRAIGKVSEEYYARISK